VVVSVKKLARNSLTFLVQSGEWQDFCRRQATGCAKAQHQKRGIEVTHAPNDTRGLRRLLRCFKVHSQLPFADRNDFGAHHSQRPRVAGTESDGWRHVPPARAGKSAEMKTKKKTTAQNQLVQTVA
jgi:hypothetical protein